MQPRAVDAIPVSPLGSDGQLRADSGFERAKKVNVECGVLHSKQITFFHAFRISSLQIIARVYTDVYSFCRDLFRLYALKFLFQIGCQPGLCCARRYVLDEGLDRLISQLVDERAARTEIETRLRKLEHVLPSAMRRGDGHVEEVDKSKAVEDVLAAKGLGPAKVDYRLARCMFLHPTSIRCGPFKAVAWVKHGEARHPEPERMGRPAAGGSPARAGTMADKRARTPRALSSCGLVRSAQGSAPNANGDAACTASPLWHSAVAATTQTHPRPRRFSTRCQLIRRSLGREGAATMAP